MQVEMSAILDATADQRNQSQDALATMTAYAKALEARIAELEKATSEAPALVADTPANVTQ